MVQIFGLVLWFWAGMRLGLGFEVKMLVWGDGVSTKSTFSLLLDVMPSTYKGSKKFDVIMLQFSVLWRGKGQFCFTCFQSFFVCVFWYEWGFTCNFSLLTIVQLRWQVASDSIIFNLDLLSSLRLVFLFLSFRISASRNCNLLWSLLLPDFSHLRFLYLNY